MTATALRTTLASLVLATLAAPAPAQPVPQTPITVQVINDSGVPDSAVYLLLTGQDVGIVPATGVASYYPFSANGVATSPAGLVNLTTGPLLTTNGSFGTATAPLLVTASAGNITAAFAPATIAAGGTATLTVTLPDAGAAPASQLTQPFTVAMPAGVTITSTADAGTCGAIDVVSSTQVWIGPGSAIPKGGCTIKVNVTSSTLGTATLWTPYLQTGGNYTPGAAALQVVGAQSGPTAAFVPPTIAAAQGVTSTLTLTLPNAGAPATLTSAFVATLPPGVVTTGAATTTCAAQPAVTATTITLPSGTALASGGCTIAVGVAPLAAGGALSQLQSTGATVTSPYTGQSRPVYTFTASTVSSGIMYFSFANPITYPTAPTVRSNIRFQPLEFSYSNAITSNGDLTSIDFYGIPLELTTFGASDAQQRHPLDRVTYYTSTASLLAAFRTANPGVECVIRRTDGLPFDRANPLASFARIVGPNQLAAGGSPPLVNCPATAPPGWNGVWPPTPATGSAWPYPSFAQYLDSLVNAGYTFTESDNQVISAYTFSYTGTIKKMTAASSESCLPPGLAVDGWLIKLTGTTAAASPLPANADICIPLPRTAGTTAAGIAYGSADFVVYGAVQNCETLGIAAGSAYACADNVPSQVIPLTNSVYGWIQADVLSALNFGYLNGVADAAFGGGQSSVWYGLPPVQYPFGAARAPDKSGSNDGYYNGWAAMMYKHSDAYGFAFSDRNGRPSPDIAFPVGGTLRIWILPDTRLDAPMVTATPGTCTQSTPTTCTMALAWPAVANADHYTVTWSPPYATQSATVTQPAGATATYTVTGLTPGTPYTFTVRAANAGATQQSFEVPVYASTAGTTPSAAAGNVQFQFGFNWKAPAYLTASATKYPTLNIAGQSAAYDGSTRFTISQTTPISVGPPPASAALVVVPPDDNQSPFLIATTGTPSGSAVDLALLLGSGGGPLTMTSPLNMPMPAGVTLSQSAGQAKASTCIGANVQASGLTIGAVAQPAGGCIEFLTLTAAGPGSYAVTASPLVTAGGSTPAAGAAFTVAGGNPVITQTIHPTTGIDPGGNATLTITIANPAGTDAALVEPFVDDMPVGVSILALGTGSGTCPGVTSTPYTITIPAGATLPAAGCTIVATVTSQTVGSVANTTGTVLTSYPVTSFPMQLVWGGNTIWAANYYLTMMGVPDAYAVGVCQPTDNCIGSGLPNVVPWNTPRSPNFLERQSAAAPLAITGGEATAGPPFGGTVNYAANVSVSFTPVANKQAAPVVFPGAGTSP